MNINKFQNLGKKSSLSFTLIEILIVLSIITILSGFVIVNNISSRAFARDRQRMADFAAYQTALQEYYSKHKTYVFFNETECTVTAPAVIDCNWNAGPPGTCDCLAFVGPPQNEGFLKPLKDEGFLEPLPIDPLNAPANFYQYRYVATDDGQEYKLYVHLERDEIAEARDGGTCPPAAGCPMGATALYEVFSKIGSLIAITYPKPGITQYLSCDIIQRSPPDPDADTTCTNADGVPVLRLSNSGESTTGGAHAQLLSYVLPPPPTLEAIYTEYVICCWGPPDLEIDCTAPNHEVFLHLSGPLPPSPLSGTNAHVAEMPVLVTDTFTEPPASGDAYIASKVGLIVNPALGRVRLKLE